MRSGGRLRRLWATAPGTRPAWWVTFALVSGLFGLWSLASPLNSVPDEGAHVAAAVATVRGQFGGGKQFKNQMAVMVEVRVPEFYARANEAARCFAMRPDQPAGCAPRIRGSGRPELVATQFANYPPLPYLFLGVPSLLPESVTALRLMRLVGALACAALIASGLVSAASLGRGMTVAATLLAVTPMAAFLAGSVNTSGLEIAAGIALWPSLLALLRAGRAAPTRLIVRVAVAAGALALNRPLSPLWLGLIVVMVVVAAGWRSVHRVLGDRRVIAAAVTVGVLTALSIVWVLLSGSLGSIAGAGRGHGFATDFLASTGRFESRLREMIGVLGWLDTPPPAGLVLAWVGAAGGLILLAVGSGGRRGLLALAGTAALVYLVPATIEAARAKTSGFPWQGRYTLPFAAGVLVLAGWIVDQNPAAMGTVAHRARRTLVAVACGAQLVAHMWSMRRYVAGFHGRVVYFLADGWRPPLPAWALLIAFAAVLTGLGLWVDRLAGEGDVAPAGP